MFLYSFTVRTLSYSLQKDYAAAVLTVLERFGYDISKLDGKKVHSMYNVMTLLASVHDYFDQLKLWFEPTVG